jgi:hypothetical protein
MQRRKFIQLSMALTPGFIGQAQAQAQEDFEKLNQFNQLKPFKLLDKDFDIGALHVLPPPKYPKDDIEEARQLVAMKSLRTAGKIAEIRAQEFNPMPFFWMVAGLDPASHPEHSKWISDALDDVEIVVLALKRQFNRPRPHLVLSEVEPVIEVPWHAAYPSGHATQAMVAFRLLETFAAPSKAKDLHDFAIEVGRNREIAGVHYPSDTDAGFKLGQELAGVLNFASLGPKVMKSYFKAHTSLN